MWPFREGHDNIISLVDKNMVYNVLGVGKKNLQIKGPGVCTKHFWQKSKGVTGAAYITENIHQGGPDNDITIEQNGGWVGPLKRKKSGTEGLPGW